MWKSSSISICSVLIAATAAADGRDVFSSYCAPCHGARGDGKGPLAAELAIRPRDFTRGVYKFRSTPAGSPPLRSDLRRTVDDGLRGTSMVGWRRVLSPAQRDEVVDYIMSLSPRFAQEGDVEAVAIPPEPQPAASSVGAQAYVRMKCHECHGSDGLGKGPSSPTLKDDLGRGVPMPDITRRWHIKRGETRDLVRTILTGLDSTPMPAYEGALSDEEVWALARYVRGISREPRWWERLLLASPVIWKGER